MTSSADSGAAFVAGPASADLTRQLDLPLPDLPPRHVLTIIGGGPGLRLGSCPCGWSHLTASHPDLIAAAFSRHKDGEL